MSANLDYGMVKPPCRRAFASDNNSGVIPEVWEALRWADEGHVVGYGDDAFTLHAVKRIQDVFERQCEVFFVFNGTAANSLVVAASCLPYQAVICHRFAHIETDEANAPGFFAHGVKTLAVEGARGKLDPSRVRQTARERRDLHASEAALVSITQATELGTVYRPEEIGAIADVARECGLRLHVDGARFANAVAALNVAPADMTWRVGVDALSMGGTKNGMLASEAVVVFDPALAKTMRRRIKQAGQLASKMRYHAAQWMGALEKGAWLKHANHANAMAARLASGLEQVPGVKLVHPREANAVFVTFPQGIAEKLQEAGWRFYSDVGPWGSRLMCSWNTTEADVDDFVCETKAALGGNLQG